MMTGGRKKKPNGSFDKSREKKKKKTKGGRRQTAAAAVDPVGACWVGSQPGRAAMASKVHPFHPGATYLSEIPESEEGPAASMSMADEGEGLEGGDVRQLAASAAYPADGAATRGSLPRRSISGANPTLAEIKRVRDALSRRARMDAKPQAATSHLVPALVGCMGIVQALAGEAPPIAGATSLALGCLVAGCVSAALGVFLCMLPLLHAPGPPRGDTPGAALLWLASVRTRSVFVFFSLFPLDHQPTNADTPCAMLSLHCGWLMRPTTLSLLCWFSHLAMRVM
jgi:hypothetical protein